MKRHIAIKAFVTVVVLLIFAGCQFGLEPENEDTAVDEFVSLFDVSYELELQGTVSISDSLASAGVPDFSELSASTTVNAPTGGIEAPGSGSVDNFPEPGQTTEYEVVVSSEYPGFFEITAVTTPMRGYEDQFVAQRTEETWYVDDNDDDGIWEQSDGGATDPAGLYGSLRRAKQSDFFEDGTERKYVILATSDPSSPTQVSYAPFDYEGSMEFPEEALSGEYVPATDGSASFSSQVTYIHELDRTLNFWFRSGSVVNPTIQGVRYYTEHENGSGQLIGTTYALEVVHGVVNGSSETLSETVIRKEVTFDPDGDGGWTAVDRKAKMVMVIENEVAGENVVIGKFGRLLEKLPPKAQQAILRHIWRMAELSTGLDWDDIELRFE